MKKRILICVSVLLAIVCLVGVFAARNAVDFLDGKELKTLLNPEYKANVK